MFKSIIPSYLHRNNQDWWIRNFYNNYTRYINKLILIGSIESELKDNGSPIPSLYLPVSNNKYRNLINRMTNYGF